MYHRRIQQHTGNTSTHSVDQTLFPPSGNETISDTLHQRFTNELLSPDQSICERVEFEVELEKQPTFGIGITIVGGDIAGKQDLGIFVKSVTTDGPAYKDGRIKPGDRLIAINDKNLEGLQHHEAVNMIKESSDSVKLMISQVRPPGSIKRGDNYNEEDTVFQGKLKDSMMDKQKHLDEENSSFDQSAEENISPDVITVRNCTSVHNQVNTDKFHKNVQNVEKHEKNVNTELEIENLEKQIVVSSDQVKQTSATVDVHSTLSQVDSLNSEIAVLDLPADGHDESEHSGESDTDSEYEDVINKVIENTYRPSHSANSTSESEEMDEFEVFLEKQQGSFGLNVTGGVNTSVRHGGIYVKSIIKNSAADNDGTIQKGDRILEVDNTSMEGYTHKQAVEALCNVPPFCKFLIGRLSSAQPASESPGQSAVSSGHNKNTTDEAGNQVEDIYSTFVTEDNTYAVDLVKGSYGLGFSTVGGSQEETAEIEDRVVRIKRVFPIGPASDSGMIHTGDVLLAVNGQSVAGLSHNETMSRLRGAGKHVQLLMCSPDPEQLSPLAPAEGAESLEITPTGSTSNVTDTESDSDSDIDVTPRRQVLITPPTGFAMSPFPKDSDGNILPRVASPPPPLPISPPPTMLSADSGDDTPRGLEVEVGVAELVDSCTTEMVLIHNTKPSANLETLNGSLIVREDSAITVNSRDNTPVTLQSSRDATPCLNITDPVSPIHDDDDVDGEDEVDSSFSEQLHTGIASADSTFVESVPDTSLNIETDLSPESTGLTEDSLHDEPSEEDNSTQDKFDSTTSLPADGLVAQSTLSEDIQLNQETLGTSLVNTYTVEDSCAIDNDRLDVDNADVDDDSENSVHIKDNFNHSANSDVNIEATSLKDDARSSDGSDDDDVDEDDDVVERLKKKYLEMEKEEEDDNDNNSDNESDKDIIEQSSDNDESEHNDSIDLININEEDNIIDNAYDADKVEDTEEVELDQTDNEDEIDENKDSINSDESFQMNAGDNIADQEIVEDKDDKEQLEHDCDDKIDIAECVEGEMENEEKKESVSDYSSRRESLSPTMEQPLKAGEFDVTLTKPEGHGLGFTVAGGAKSTGGCYVKAVLQNPALSDGSMKPGDKLIMVNGVDMQPLNHFEAVSVLREAEEVVTIRLFREKVPEGDTRQAGVVNLSLSETLTRADDDCHQETEEHDENNSDNKKNNDGKSDDENRSDVAADDTWPLQDLIASLQESLEESKQADQSPVGARKNVENYWRDKSQNEARSPKSLSANAVEPSVYQIDIQKPKSGGLGISLVTAETQNQTGVFIRTITPGGVAEDDGRLQVGDKILQINGESLIGMNHNKAATILRKYQGKLSLTVSRNKGKIPVLFEPETTGSQSGNTDLKSMSNEEPFGAKIHDETNKTDDNSELCNNSTLNDTSLSLTKHLPSDIVDDDVEQLVADAERILKDANDELSDETDLDTEKLGEMEESHKRLVKHSHKYLSATEVIDYKHDQINLETDEDNTEEDVFGEDSEGAREPYDKSCDTSAVKYDCDKSWCESLRTLNITVPDEVTSEWLFDLSLVTIPEDMKPSIPNIISRMQEKMTIEDPQEEFKQLRNVPLTDECDTAMIPSNRLKNRFRNVLPYDENRVKISHGYDTDYINASHVRVEVGTSVCDYVVCQGPLPETTDAFWEMIWQEKVSVIVMLTLDVEAMKVKCHRYWPDSVADPLDACNRKLRVSLLYQNCLEDFDIRNILLENIDTGETRCLYHLNYTTWPDHGTPTSALPLLQCLRLSHLYRSMGPIVVHCSAGIGRSGTFVTVDIVLAHLERGLKFDIFEIVKQLRRQRQGMIQTRDQYAFCYTACVEALLDTPS